MMDDDESDDAWRVMTKLVLDIESEDG